MNAIPSKLLAVLNLTRTHASGWPSMTRKRVASMAIDPRGSEASVSHRCAASWQSASAAATMASAARATSVAYGALVPSLKPGLHARTPGVTRADVRRRMSHRAASSARNCTITHYVSDYLLTPYRVAGCVYGPDGSGAPGAR